MNDFGEEIIRLEQELLALKTCPIKTSTQMATKSVNQPISFDLDYVGQLIQNFAWGENTVIITMESVDGTNMLTSCTLASSADASNHNLLARGIQILQSDCGNVAQYRISATSRNQNDIATLAGGGSVALNYNMILTATSDFTVSITSEPYNPF